MLSIIPSIRVSKRVLLSSLHVVELPELISRIEWIRVYLRVSLKSIVALVQMIFLQTKDFVEVVGGFINIRRKVVVPPRVCRLFYSWTPEHFSIILREILVLGKETCNFSQGKIILFGISSQLLDDWRDFLIDRRQNWLTHNQRVYRILLSPENLIQDVLVLLLSFRK